MAIANLTNSYEITDAWNDMAVSIDTQGTITELFDGDELHFGWCEEGRHAWELSNVKAIDPIPAKGQQGWWNWEDMTEKCKECNGKLAE